MDNASPPSVTNVALATAIVSGLTGYFIGQARSIGLFRSPTATAGAGGYDERAADSDLSDADSENEDFQGTGELKSFSDSREECKLVLVVRTDLGMGKGE